MKLSTKSCGLTKLCALNWSRLNELCALNWSRVCVESVALLIKSLYFPLSNTPVVGAAPIGDKSATCHPSGLHLLPTAINKWARKGNQCQKS